MADTEHNVCIGCGANGSEIPLEEGYCSDVCESKHKAELESASEDSAPAPPPEERTGGSVSLSVEGVAKMARDLAVDTGGEAEKITIAPDDVVSLATDTEEAKPTPTSAPPEPPKCEGCPAEATTEDDSGTPLCQACLEACAEDTAAEKLQCVSCDNPATTKDAYGSPMCESCLDAYTDGGDGLLVGDEPSVVEFNVAGSGREALWVDLEVDEAFPGRVSGRVTGDVPKGYPHTAVGCVKIDGETWVVSDATRGEAPGNWRLK